MSTESVNYRLVLADLIARRDRLNAAITAVEAIIGEGPSVAGPPKTDYTETTKTYSMTMRSTPEGVLKPLYGDMTIREAATSFLSSESRPCSTAKIANALEEGGIPSKSKDLKRTVYNILWDETKQANGKIAKVGTKWALRSWGTKPSPTEP